MKQEPPIAGLILLALLVLLAIFIFRKLIKRRITLNKSVDNPPKNFKNQLIDELEFIGLVYQQQDEIIVRNEDFENLIVTGELQIVLTENKERATVEITYKRSIKLTGIIITIFSIFLCYVGVLIPIYMVNQTKKKTLNKIQTIFQTIKSIN